jgi:hypothetical protein
MNGGPAVSPSGRVNLISPFQAEPLPIPANDTMRHELEWEPLVAEEIEQDPGPIPFVQTTRSESDMPEIQRQVQCYGFSGKPKKSAATKGNRKAMTKWNPVKFNIDDGAEVGLIRTDYLKANLHKLAINRIRWFTDEDVIIYSK